MRAITFKLRTTVSPMPSRTESVSATSVSMIWRVSSQDRVIDGKQEMLMSALAHQIADAARPIVTPAEATRLGMQVTIPW